jgi:ABC-type glycerol-3-phosphate transport system substrate-binding protein
MDPNNQKNFQSSNYPTNSTGGNIPSDLLSPSYSNNSLINNNGTNLSTNTDAVSGGVLNYTDPNNAVQQVVQPTLGLAGSYADDINSVGTSYAMADNLQDLPPLPSNISYSQDPTYQPVPNTGNVIDFNSANLPASSNIEPAIENAYVEPTNSVSAAPTYSTGSIYSNSNVVPQDSNQSTGYTMPPTGAYVFEEEDSGVSRMKFIRNMLLIGLIALLLLAGGYFAFTTLFKNNSTNVISSNSSKTVSSASTATPVTVTTVRVWGMWENKENYAPLIAEFERQNPTIKIDYVSREQESKVNQSEYKKSLLARLTTDTTTAPDIFLVNNNWTNEFAKYTTSIPDSVYTSTEYGNTFYSTFKSSFSNSSGQIVAIPYSFDGLGLFYNKTLLSAKGITTPAANWDQMKIDVEKLTSREANGNLIISGVSMGAMNNTAFGFDTLSLLMMQNGVSMTNLTGTQATFGSDSNATAAMNYYLEMRSKYKTWSESGPNDVQLFAEGKLAMMLAPLWRAENIKKNFPNLNFDIAATPTVLGADEIYLANYWGYSVSKYSTVQDASWKFLKFLSSKEGYTLLNQGIVSQRELGIVYPRRDMADMIATQPYLGAFVKMAPYARTWQMYDRESVEKIFVDNVGTGNVTSGILSTIASQVTAVLQKR